MSTKASPICYCDQLPGTPCDFCSGLASLDGERAARQLEWQREASRPRLYSTTLNGKPVKVTIPED